MTEAKNESNKSTVVFIEPQPADQTPTFVNGHLGASENEAVRRLQSKAITWAIVSAVLGCHWLAIPALILALRNGSSKSSYEKSIKFSIAGLVVGVFAIALYVTLLLYMLRVIRF